MQRHTDEGVVLACDFCGTDWDMERPMIEGHQGSILCLDCLARAIDEARPSDEAFDCTLCLVEREPPMKQWTHPQPGEDANPKAIVCWDCIQQADRAFGRDEDTDWRRRIPPDERWR